jgi:sugar phosphate permease
MCSPRRRSFRLMLRCSPMSPPTAAISFGEVEPAHPTRVRWCIVALLMAYSFMTWFNRTCMPVAYDDQIMEQYGISPEAIGSVYSAFFLAYTICMTPGGWVTDRLGPRLSLTLMGVGSGVFVVATGLCGLWVATAGLLVFVLLIVRALMGVFTAPIYPSSGLVISRWLPVSQRAGTNGVVQGSSAVGTICSYLIFGWLVAQFGWQTAFMITGAVTMVLAVGWWAYARDWPWEHRGTNQAERELAMSRSAPVIRATQSPNATTRANWMNLLRNRSLVLLTLSYAAVGYFEYLFIFWTHYYFKEVIHLSSLQSKLFAGSTQAGFALGMICGGWLSDRLTISFGYRWGRAAVPLFGMTASALLLLLGTVATEPAWVVTWIALANGAVGMCEGPVWTTAIELGGRYGATAAGICNTGGNAGGMIAPVATPWIGRLLTPLVGRTVAWRLALSAAAVICLLGVSLWFWIDPEQRDGTE